MIDPAAYVSASDSSATMMRAVAAALRDEWMIPEQWPGYLVALTGPANRLPAAWRSRLVGYFMRDIGVPPALAVEVTATGLAKWAVRLYEDVAVDAAPSAAGQAPADPRYNTIVLGAPSGGVAHLAALLRAPFLSQHFVTRYRYRGAADDVSTYHAFGAQLAEAILEHNADLAVVNHYDPLHDRFLVSNVNYIRMKLLDLPTPYTAFIRQHLRPGGTLLYADCHYSWGQYRIGKRHFFQVGGLGGVADADFVRDAEQTAHYLAQHGAPAGQHNWALPYPWLVEPESEWGSLPPFRQAVEDFARQNGYHFRAVRGEHPEDFSQLAFYAAYQAALNAGREPAGVLVDCFTQTSPTAALKAGLLPLWLPFNCSDSLGFLARMAPNFPAKKPVLLAPAPGFSPAWDAVSAAHWQAAANADGGSRPTVWLGVDPTAHPVDIAGIFRFVPALQAWCAAHPTVEHPPFAVADLEALVGSMAAAAAVIESAPQGTQGSAG
jgi:hypothetical protein